MGNKQDRSDIALRMRPRRRGIARLVLLAVLGLVLFGAGTAASYYVDALWFASLGFASVFWTRLSLQAATFGAFALLTFLVVYGVFRALKPDRLDALMGTTILVNRRPVRLPVEPVLKLIGLGLSVTIAAVTGASMMERWMTLALFWDAPRKATMLDPIFGRSLDFYLFTLPALQLISGWLLTLAVFACVIATVTARTVADNPDLQELPGKNITWQSLRVSFATLLFANGCAIRSVNELMLHRSLSSTARYTPIPVEDLRQVCRTAHPRA